MDRAASCRRAARDVVADVEPPRLHDVIATTLDEASMTPGVLTLESAAAIDATADLEGVAHQAAGVQLIYEGLRLTRRLAHEEPWLESDTDDDLEAGSRGDLEILAADILVARGFYLLARTDAAERAVRTVRDFGRDQTLRETPDADSRALDANLERDVLELAVRTGAAAVGKHPTQTLLAVAADVAAASGTEFPPASSLLLSTPTGEEPAEATDGGTEPTDDGRVTSAGDP
ncbi:DUF7114 family protein [Natronobiforma cellulositropha]|uniref:DUF7114 family protein n=1 Tax=Natronobiforma cellulositropha TaxID=1679076 RepID=UPI0021D5702F|nr:hypothetical protein [Natronobiforma cellulositropha]